MAGAEDKAPLGNDLSADSGARTRGGPVTAPLLTSNQAGIGSKAIKSQGFGDRVPR